jgi:hypothetical protein
LTSSRLVGTIRLEGNDRPAVSHIMTFFSFHNWDLHARSAGRLTSGMKVCLMLATLFLIAGTFAGAVRADDLEMINRPVNTDGMTGLLFTTAPYTLARGALEVAAIAITENSHVPDYTADRYRASVSYGLTDDMELAVSPSYLNLDEGDAHKARGTGDTQVSYKWNFRQQQEYSIAPALSLFVTGVFPTGDKDAGTNSVNHWGARVGMSVGSEIPIEDYILGVYADGQLAVQDLRDSTVRDRYQLFNAGVLFPISKYRNLQMFVEFNAANGIDVHYQHMTDYSAVTYGLRMVGTRFNLTFGAQMVHKTAEGYQDSSRIVSMMSVKF